MFTGVDNNAQINTKIENIKQNPKTSLPLPRQQIYDRLCDKRDSLIREVRRSVEQIEIKEEYYDEAIYKNHLKEALVENIENNISLALSTRNSYGVEFGNEDVVDEIARKTVEKILSDPEEYANDHCMALYKVLESEHPQILQKLPDIDERRPMADFSNTKVSANILVRQLTAIKKDPDQESFKVQLEQEKSFDQMTPDEIEDQYGHFDL